MAAQSALETARAEIQSGHTPDVNALAIAAARRLTFCSLRTVFNLTGVILHTGLGRAPLEAATFGDQYLNLEFDLETGKRGDRQDHIRELLCELTGAEDAFVVNNAAAGVLLTMTALCKGKQVILSRGQSVEIGGSFRLSEIVKSSGCKLVDVGATNKVYIDDYTSAITPQTAAILRCHPSNYEVKGFVSEPALEDLSKAAIENNVLLINDQGNGALIDFNQFGISEIETLPQSVRYSDISIGSGDKLMGGPQCGIIVGRKSLISKIKRHPIARAVRIDKYSLLTLQRILMCYRRKSYDDIPFLRILMLPAETVKQWCEIMAPEGALVKPSISELGSGSGSGKGVQSYSVVLPSKKPDKLSKALRESEIIGRIEDDAVWLDPRCDSRIYNSWNPQRKESVILDDLRRQIAECWEKWK